MSLSASKMRITSTPLCTASATKARTTTGGKRE